MSNFTPSQLAELKQMLTPGTGSVTRTPGGTSGNFTPSQIQELRKIVLAVTTDASKGRYAGFGNPQVDTYNYPDNCTATFPWTFDFVIPKNFQRWTSVHLSFKLRAFRRYVSAVNSATSAAAPHVHYWSVGGTATNPTPVAYIGITNYGTSTASLGPGNGVVPPAPLAWQTSTEANNATVGASVQTGGSEAYSVSGHTHTVAPTLATGIFEDTSPTSVTLKLDGVDYTTALGGPWTTDTVELDITRVMPTTLSAFHNIQLTPNQNGRITGELRFSYFVDASVNA